MDPTANVAPVLADCRVTTLTPSPRTAAVVRERFGGEPIDVGLSIADVFFHAGDRKQSGMVAVLADSAEPSTGRLADTLRNLRVVRIEDLPEADAAAALRASEFFLFLSQARRSPLAVIEALAAGCVVLSVPTEHVAACLVDGVNGVLAAEALLGARLLDLCAPAARVRRSALYDRGRATASAFRRARHGRHVAALLEGPLAFLRS
jgi:glycosyltransferase involved in cell wall biosynthesis